MSDFLWCHGLQNPWNSPGQNTGVGSYSLLHGIFPTQGSHPGFPHCRQILYQLSYQGSPLLNVLESVSESEVAQSCLTLCDPMDCSPPGFSIHGIFQARILEWGAISHFTLWATREAPHWMYWMHIIKFWWIKRCITIKLVFPGGSNGKESACNAGDLGSILDWEYPLGKGAANHSSTLAWRIPWSEEPGGLQSMGL